eukprot:4710688-Karenia_brevis.AAC.2
MVNADSNPVHPWPPLTLFGSSCLQFETRTSQFEIHDHLHHLSYLDGRSSPPGLPGCTPSPPGLPGWTTFPHLDYLHGQPSPPDHLDDGHPHHLDYLDGQPSPPELPGWTTLTTWIT